MLKGVCGPLRTGPDQTRSDSTQGPRPEHRYDTGHRLPATPCSLAGYELPLGADPVYRGGPVRDKSITMLHSNDWQSTSTIEVTPKFSLTSDDLMLRRFAAGDVPNGYKFCTGVSIWHNQQLASEVQNGHWLMVDLTKHYVFDYDGLTQWDLSIETAAKHTMDRYFA